MRIPGDRDEDFVDVLLYVQKSPDLEVPLIDDNLKDLVLATSESEVGIFRKHDRDVHDGTEPDNNSGGDYGHEGDEDYENGSKEYYGNEGDEDYDNGGEDYGHEGDNDYDLW